MAEQMQLDAVSSGSARQSDQAYDLLKNEIILCHLRPGADFSEIELSTRFVLARAATRAALIRLTQVGLVQPVPRHGFKISPVTVASIKELFELRLIVEPHIAALAIGKLDVRRLRQINRQPQTADSPEKRLAFLDSNREFHRAFAIATGNARLVRLVESIADEMTRLVHLGLFSDHQSDDKRVAADAEHEAIITAFQAKDAEATRRAVAIHIEHARQMTIDQIISGDVDLALT
jgi:DNA-binding GntR family transcriptional regulator